MVIVLDIFQILTFTALGVLFGMFLTLILEMFNYHVTIFHDILPKPALFFGILAFILSVGYVVCIKNVILAYNDTKSISLKYDELIKYEQYQQFIEKYSNKLSFAKNYWNKLTRLNKDQRDNLHTEYCKIQYEMWLNDNFSFDKNIDRQIDFFERMEEFNSDASKFTNIDIHRLDRKIIFSYIEKVKKPNCRCGNCFDEVLHSLTMSFIDK